jgi:hypothetical protein
MKDKAKSIKKRGKKVKKQRVKLTTHPHQPLGNSQPSMRPHNTQRSNMTMRFPIRRFLLHLRKNISNDLGVLTRDIPRDPGSGAAGAASLVAILRPDDGYKAQLRPG